MAEGKAAVSAFRGVVLETPQLDMCARFYSTVWALDEVDRLFSKPYASEVFGLFRSWHNRRQLEPDGPWSMLTMAIAYATEAHLFITDLHQSPFNVGTRLELSDFNLEQVSDLNNRYGAPLRDNADIAIFYALLRDRKSVV